MIDSNETIMYENGREIGYEGGYDIGYSVGYVKGVDVGYIDGVKEFAAYLKKNSFMCDPDNMHSFQAINVEDDLDDLVEEFLKSDSAKLGL